MENTDLRVVRRRKPKKHYVIQDYTNGRSQIREDGKVLKFEHKVDAKAYRDKVRGAVERKELRFNCRYKFKNRAALVNLDVLNNIIRKRRELVSVLGYSTYTEYRTEDRMANNPNNVWKFENDLKDKLRPKAEIDIQKMLLKKSELFLPA